MAFQGPQYGDIHANLAVSQSETQTGSSRVINLPGGRTVTVHVPAGIKDGEAIRVAGYGGPSGPGGPVGDLVLRVSVVSAPVAADSDQNQRTFITPMDPISSPPVSLTTPSQPGYNPASLPPGYNPASFSPGYNPPPPPPVDPAYYRATAPMDPASGPYTPVSAPGGPQSYPGTGTYPGYATPGQAVPQYPPPYFPPQPQAPEPKRSSTLLIVSIILVVALLLGSGLFFYASYYQPHQAQLAATAQAQAQGTGTAVSAATDAANITQGTARAVASSTARAQATAQGFQNIYTQATSGTPTFSDVMSAQTARHWDEITSTANGACTFQSGAYHSLMPSVGFFQPCFAENTNLGNFAFQVDMKLLKGTIGGIIFRADSTNNHYYLFRISTDGHYDLFAYIGSQASSARSLLGGNTDLMKPGQSNRITLVAQGSALHFFINQKYLNSISDGTYTAGQIGVFGDSSSQATDAAFSNVKAWSL